MKGKVCKWNDEKGFGFILSEEFSENVFFHISDVKTITRRPRNNDVVLFELTRDSQQRPRAKNIVIEGISAVLYAKPATRIAIEPPKKNLFDYVLLSILLIIVVATVRSYYIEHNTDKLASYGIGAFVTCILLTRKKKPKEKHFTCFSCNAVTHFDKRTINAWNSGMTKLYCYACHVKWLRNHPSQETHSVGRSGGCLGIFVALSIIPVSFAVTVYRWLS
jgi:cold shock CspA family protein